MYVKSREQGKSGTFCHTAYVFRRIGCEESCESRIVQVILSGVCGVLYITSVEQKHAECGEDQVESELGMSGLDFFLDANLGHYTAYYQPSHLYLWGAR